MKLAGLVLAAGLLAGCGSTVSSAPAAPAVLTPAATVPAVSPASAPVTAPAPPVTPAPAVTHHRTRYPADWKLPDRKLSPGAVQPGYTIADICPHVNRALEAMRPSTSEKEAVYRAYGIFSHPAGKYEIDHVDAVELLGLVDAPAGDPTLNLYPELNDTPDPVMLARYHLSAAFVHNSKDILEDVLHSRVCAGIVPLTTAQHAIETDWRRAYVTYVGPPPSHAHSPAPPPASVGPVAVAPASSAAPAAASCYPRTSGGNCYRAGEYCRTADRGASGIAGNGERITCENRNGWRWEAS
jgi:hypothetical protein